MSRRVYSLLQKEGRNPFIPRKKLKNAINPHTYL
jgi:hypothetical protein